MRGGLRFVQVRSIIQAYPMNIHILAKECELNFVLINQELRKEVLHFV